jgi:hypothetical protein
MESEYVIVESYKLKKEFFKKSKTLYSRNNLEKNYVSIIRFKRN